MTLGAWPTPRAASLEAPAAPRAGNISLPALLAAFIVLQSAIAGFTSQVDLPGGFSVQAILTLAYAVFSWLVIAWNPHLPRPAFQAIWPALALLAYAVLSLAWTEISTVAIQNLSVLAAFVGIMAVTATFARTDRRFAPTVMKAFWWAVTIASLQYLVVVGLYGPGTTENPIMPARPYAMFALLGLAAVLAGWRYRNRAGLAIGILTLATIALSLSRTSLIIAVVLFALMWIPARGAAGWLRLTLLSAIAVGALLWAINNVPALHERFFEGDVTLGSGAFAINASGRTMVWAIVLESWQNSPWLGQGPGSASPPLEERLPDRGINGHPHNDYLRVLHDYGVVGLALFALTLLTLFHRLFRLWTQDHVLHSPAAPTLLAALLGMIGFMGMMATDNPFAYGFFMGPLAVLLGTALGAASRERAGVPTST
jgi:O-antigen ligase